MVSELAKGDIEDLRVEGLTPTFEDIIRLNQLALRITNGRETTAACAPRHAIVGGIVFWEPTLAAWDWVRFAMDFTEARIDEDLVYAFACANSRIRGAFDGLYEPDALRDRLLKFRKTLSATRGEISRAVLWCVTGIDDVRPDPTPIAIAREQAKHPSDREVESFGFVESMLSQAASATGLTFDDIMLQTPSRLSAMLYDYYVKSGADMTKTAARAQADYLCTLHNIHQRLLAERADNLAHAAADGADGRRDAVDDERGDDAGTHDGEQNKPNHSHGE